MKTAFYYLLAGLFGVMGSLAVARSIEVTLSAKSPAAMQGGMGLGMLLVAWKIVEKARTTKLPRRTQKSLEP